MINSIKNTLEEFKLLIEQLKPEMYVNSCKYLSDGSIGQHTRHIIEMFQCLNQGYGIGYFSYDKRQRNKSIENEIHVAIVALEEIILSVDKPDKNLMSEYEIAEKTITIETSYFRELMYNLEHCIHHQALIKVALIEDASYAIPENFGVAPSTIAFRQTCVQ